MAAVIKTLAQVTVAATNVAQQLSTGQEIAQSLHVTAPATNSGTIYIGDADVDSTQFLVELAPGDEADITGNSVVGTTDDIEFKSVYIYGTQNDVLKVGYQKRSN